MSLHDLAVDDRRTLRAAGAQIDRLEMIEAEQLQHGRVEVVGVDRILDGLQADLVGLRHR